MRRRGCCFPAGGAGARRPNGTRHLTQLPFTLRLHTLHACSRAHARARAQVELLLPDESGELRPVPLAFTLRSASSRLLVVPLSLPLGLVFEERNGACELVELLPDGSAAQSATQGRGVRLQPGDVLRATTACVLQMEYGALNLLGGGIGRPRTRAVAVRVCEGEAWGEASFPRAMAAIASNGRAGRTDVTLVLERFVS